MATTVERLELPPLEFGVLPTFFNNNRLNPPPGKFYDTTPRLAKPYKSFYIDKGVSTCSLNEGAPEYTALEKQYRSTFSGAGTLQSALGGKTWQQASAAECTSAGNYMANVQGGFHIFTSGAQEHRYDNDPYVQEHILNPAGWVALEKEITRVQEARGGKNFGSYGGVMGSALHHDIPAFRTALQSNKNAFDYLAARPYDRHPYFNIGAYQYLDCLLNQYYRSSSDLHTRFIELVGAPTLCRMALQHVQSNRQLMNFIFRSKTEFVRYVSQGYSNKYVQKFGNYTIEEYGFPDYAPSHQIDQGFHGWDLYDRIYTWEDWQLFSDQPNKFEPNYFRESDNFPQKVERDQNGNISNALPKTPSGNPYDPSREYPWPTTPMGTNDLTECGMKLYEQATAHVGGAQGAQWLRHRTPGSANWCSSGAGYLADRQEDRLALARGLRNGNNAWLKVTDNNMDFNDGRELEADFGDGKTAVVKVFGNTTNLYKITF
jgi:hypothetical protein